MQQYLYRIQPIRWEMLTEGATPFEQEKVGEHFAYLQRLVAQGTALLAGRTQTTSQDGMGIIIFRAENDQTAQQIVEADPAVKSGVFTAQLHQYKVALLAKDTTSWMPK